MSTRPNFGGIFPTCHTPISPISHLPCFSAFQLGAGRVIRGWEKAIEGMTLGEKIEVTIGPKWAYRKSGVQVPPQSPLRIHMRTPIKAPPPPSHSPLRIHTRTPTNVACNQHRTMMGCMWCHRTQRSSLRWSSWASEIESYRMMELVGEMESYDGHTWAHGVRRWSCAFGICNCDSIETCSRMSTDLIVRDLQL